MMFSGASPLLCLVRLCRAWGKHNEGGLLHLHTRRSGGGGKREHRVLKRKGKLSESLFSKEKKNYSRAHFVGG
jgi:hypothetical protein